MHICLNPETVDTNSVNVMCNLLASFEVSISGVFTRSKLCASACAITSTQICTHVRLGRSIKCHELPYTKLEGFNSVFVLVTFSACKLFIMKRVI